MSKRIQTLVIDTWEDFKAQIIPSLFPKSNTFRRGHYIFRGHRVAEWKLTPSYDRWVEQKLPTKDRNLLKKLSHELYDHFRRECASLADVPRNIWEDETLALALGQHHGLPTRLLDWTESPYMAAFFAFSHDLLSPEKASDQVAIWALTVNDPIWSSDIGVKIVDASALDRYNLRLHNQFGTFTLSRTPSACLEDYVKSCGDSGPVVLRKFTIPNSEAKIAIADLDVMGINFSRIFPDISGYAQSAVMRLVLDHPT